MTRKECVCSDEQFESNRSILSKDNPLSYSGMLCTCSPQNKNFAGLLEGSTATASVLFYSNEGYMNRTRREEGSWREEIIDAGQTKRIKEKSARVRDNGEISAIARRK